MTNRRKFIHNMLKISALTLTYPALSKSKKFNEEKAMVHLLPADKNGIRLPYGFKSRVVATEGKPAAKNSNYLWHERPDGGAVYRDFSRENMGGWIYVSNEESKTGGVGALKFNSEGDVIDSYRILDNTLWNCAGGKTPWNTWLSAEEFPYGMVWECDPYGNNLAKSVPCLGSFEHEACAVDPVNRTIYLTEDEKNGCFYRTVLPNYPSYDKGQLQVAAIEGDPMTENAKLVWHDVPNPNPKKPELETRYQVKQATIFNGGEGLWYFAGYVYFSTKGDNRIWSLNTDTQQIKVIYDFKTSQFPVLSGVDNITVDNNGYLYVCEDGGNMQIVVLSESGQAIPLLHIKNQRKSEITGVAFTEDGKRMYFSSQRGPSSNGNLGITYEVTGPFEHIGQFFD
jgi:secreted PhoX family phosphatase